MKNIQELRAVDISTLSVDADKDRKQLVEEIAKLSRNGKKNSVITKKLRKDIARRETVINEKVTNQVEGK